MSTGSLNFPPPEPRPATSMGVMPSRFIGREAWLESLRPRLNGLREGDRRGLLVLSDMLTMVASGSAGGLLAGASMSMELLVAWGGIALASLYTSNQYSLEPHDERTIAKGVAGASGLTLAASWVLGQGFRAPAIVATGCLAYLALVGTRRAWTWLLSSRATRRRALLLCDGPDAVAAVDEIRRHPLSGLRPLGLVSERDLAGDAPLSHLGTPGQLPLLTDAWKADSIVAGPAAVHRPDWQEAVGPGPETLDLPRLFERLSHRIPVRQVDERWFIEQFTWTRGLGYALGKRVLDVGLSLFGLAIALPYLPLVAIANALDDRGPLFYSQERVGRQGRCFQVYKLRTMRVDAEKHGATWAQANDPRVTRIGAFLRSTRLDEIPQLWNVLKGDMSLVGPRPERPEFVKELARQIPHYQRRHMVAPGVTGWAQVRFPYGSSVQDSEEKLKFDLYYVKHRSLFFDLLIVLRTVSVVLSKTGAR